MLRCFGLLKDKGGSVCSLNLLCYCWPSFPAFLNLLQIPLILVSPQPPNTMIHQCVLGSCLLSFTSCSQLTPLEFTGGKLIGWFFCMKRVLNSWKKSKREQAEVERNGARREDQHRPSWYPWELINTFKTRLDCKARGLLARALCSKAFHCLIPFSRKHRPAFHLSKQGKACQHNTDRYRALELFTL